MLTAIALFLLSQNQPCTNVRPCVTQSLTYSRPYSQFETCTRSIYTRTIVDADAGVIRMCQLDGGWEAIGSSGGGSSSSYWYDGGAGYITATEDLLKSGSGANFNESPTTTGQSYVLKHSGGTAMFPRIVFKNSDDSIAGDIGSANFNGYSAGVGVFIRNNCSSGSSCPIRFANPNMPIYGTSGPSFGFTYGTFGAPLNNTGLALNAYPSDNAIYLPNQGRIDLGVGSTDYLVSDGTNTVVAGGVRLGGTSASVITSSYECDWSTDGGNGINAETQREYLIGCTGVKPNAECVMSVPGGGTFQTQGVSVDCYAPDNNQIGVRTYNWTSGTDGLSPKQGTYKIRVFNNQ